MREGGKFSIAGQVTDDNMTHPRGMLEMLSNKKM